MTVIVTVSGLICIIYISLTSFSQTGNWLAYWQIIPFYLWIIIGIFIAFLIIVSLNRWRINRKQFIGRDSAPRIQVIREYFTYAESTYRDVIWIIKHPKRTEFRYYSEFEPEPNLIKVDYTPRCPYCKTELIEYQNFLGYYIWNCINCGFSKWSVFSFGKTHDDIKKIVKREIEEDLERKHENQLKL
nr:hypothetical protein [uncultured Methanoregula sp.]